MAAQASPSFLTFCLPSGIRVSPQLSSELSFTRCWTANRRGKYIIYTLLNCTLWGRSSLKAATWKLWSWVGRALLSFWRKRESLRFVPLRPSFWERFVEVLCAGSLKIIEFGNASLRKQNLFLVVIQINWCRAFWKAFSKHFWFLRSCAYTFLPGCVGKIQRKRSLLKMRSWNEKKNSLN